MFAATSKPNIKQVLTVGTSATVLNFSKKTFFQFWNISTTTPNFNVIFTSPISGSGVGSALQNQSMGQSVTIDAGGSISIRAISGTVTLNYIAFEV